MDRWSKVKGKGKIGRQTARGKKRWGNKWPGKGRDRDKNKQMYGGMESWAEVGRGEWNTGQKPAVGRDGQVGKLWIDTNKENLIYKNCQNEDFRCKAGYSGTQ